MEKIVEIINLNYGNLFESLYLDVLKNDFLMITGKNGCGKTLLANMIVGNIPTYDNILIDSELINYYDKNNILLVDKLRYNSKQKVSDIINNFDSKEATRILKSIKKLYLLDKYCNSLSSGELQIINTIISILSKNKIIIIDDALSFVDKITKIKLIKELKKLSDNKISTIVYFTSDIEDLIYAKNIAIINNKKIIVDFKEDILNDDHILLSVNQKLPFIADLCFKLKYYNLVDKLILDKVKLVNKIWK